jgi:hypothetical protein
MSTATGEELDDQQGATPVTIPTAPERHLTPLNQGPVEPDSEPLEAQ